MIALFLVLVATMSGNAWATTPLLGPDTTIAPPRAPKSCAVGERKFPFLKPWVEKLDRFIAPFEVGSNEGSLFFAIGVTDAGKGAAEKWKSDSVTLKIDWKKKSGTIETAWMGTVPPPGKPVATGPGESTVRLRSKGLPFKSATRVDPREPMLKDYSDAALKEAARRGGSTYWARLWSVLFTESELDLLSKCSTSSCKIKFDDNELKLVAGASHQYRLDKFREVIEKRIDDFQKKGEIRAYEGTHLPLDWEDLPISPMFPAKYNTHFWLPKDRSSFGYELLDAEPGHHKAVAALFSRQCEKRDSGGSEYTACTDVVIYNNHYFDFWARVVLFFPWCDTEVALAYEAVDVDQIKSSRVVRVLFGSEMRQLFGELLETRLRRIHMLGHVVDK